MKTYCSRHKKKYCRFILRFAHLHGRDKNTRKKLTISKARDHGFYLKCFWSVDVNKSWLSQLKLDRINNIKPRRTVSAGYLKYRVVVDYPIKLIVTFQ